jgi:hypothetical protein
MQRERNSRKRKKAREYQKHKVREAHDGDLFLQISASVTLTCIFVTRAKESEIRI